MPGAGGRRSFWAPVAEQLRADIDVLLLGWPGFGDEPPNPAIERLSDLTAFVIERIHAPIDVVAQSMGCVVAMQLALQRPDLVQRLVLCGASGGIDLQPFGAADWREDYEDEGLPESMPRWFVDDRSDLGAAIPSITAPTLLLWGERDEISPPAAAAHFEHLLPNARLEIIPGGEHSFPIEQPGEAAVAIDAFLRQSAAAPARGA